MAILTVSTDEVGMEEAWIRTRKLLPGLSVKAGKFFSDIGYINKQHPHQWDFVDQNLPYAMFFDGQIDEVGVQVAYLPKTPVYMLIGGEALQGTNPGVANYLGAGREPGPLVQGGTAPLHRVLQDLPRRRLLGRAPARSLGGLRHDVPGAGRRCRQPGDKLVHGS